MFSDELIRGDGKKLARLKPSVTKQEAVGDRHQLLTLFASDFFRVERVGAGADGNLALL
jgi:hypothetical protein